MASLATQWHNLTRQSAQPCGPGCVTVAVAVGTAYYVERGQNLQGGQRRYSSLSVRPRALVQLFGSPGELAQRLANARPGPNSQNGRRHYADGQFSGRTRKKHTRRTWMAELRRDKEGGTQSAICEEARVCERKNRERQRQRQRQRAREREMGWQGPPSKRHRRRHGRFGSFLG